MMDNDEYVVRSCAGTKHIVIVPSLQQSGLVTRDLDTTPPLR